MVINEVEVLRAACCIAGLDQQVSERERPHLEALAERIGVGRASLNAMIERAQQDQNFYTEQFRIARADPVRAMQTLFKVALADRQLSTEERVILQHFAEKLGLDAERFMQLLAAAEQKAAPSHNGRQAENGA